MISFRPPARHAPLLTFVADTARRATARVRDMMLRRACKRARAEINTLSAEAWLRSTDLAPHEAKALRRELRAFVNDRAGDRDGSRERPFG